MKYQLVVVVLVLCAPMLLARRENNAQRDNRRLEKQAARKCAYAWGECRFEAGKTCGNGKKTGTSDNAECPERQVERPCKVKCGAAATPAPPSQTAGKKPSKGGKPASECQYKPARDPAGSRPVCDPVSKKKAVTQTLVSGGPSCQQTMTTYKPCRPRHERDTMAAGEDSKCKYKRGQKGECNAATSKRTIQLTLKRKSPASCPATKTIEKPCKVKPAKQERGGDRRRGRPNNRRQEQVV